SRVRQMNKIVAPPHDLIHVCRTIDELVPCSKEALSSLNLVPLRLNIPIERFDVVVDLNGKLARNRIERIEPSGHGDMRTYRLGKRHIRHPDIARGYKLTLQRDR